MKEEQIILYVCFTLRRWCKKLFYDTFDTWLVPVWLKKNPWSGPRLRVAFSRWPSVQLWFLGWIPSSSISERLSGWWKDVMKWCDISSVDELTAKLWPDATSLFLTDWMIDSQDMQSLINSTHWQRGTLRGHFTGDVCQQFCLENDTLDAFIFYPYKMWTFFTLAVWKTIILQERKYSFPFVTVFESKAEVISHQTQKLLNCFLKKKEKKIIA